jgi:hypothetical protein
MTMRERLARAICDTAGYEWDDLTAEAFREQADAALAAMHDPPDSVLNAMADTLMLGEYGQSASSEASAMWEAGLNAARNEEAGDDG